MSARDNILQRLREVLDEELVEAEAELHEADSDEHEAELDLLELGAERDQLAAELEIARARIAELQQQVQAMAEQINQPAHCFQDRSRPALNTPESAADFAEAGAPRRTTATLFGGQA